MNATTSQMQWMGKALIRRMFVGIVSATLLAFSGCVICDNLPPRPAGGSGEAWAAISNGGPVPLADKPIPGADIRPVATYACDV